MTDQPLAGKVALVTGCSPNIGGVLASGLADAGATVACNDLIPSVAEERVATLQAAGHHAMAVPFDVTDEDAAMRGVAAVLDGFGQIDILVNNAVKFDLGGILDMSIERFRQQVDVIMGGAFIMTQLVAHSMIERKVEGSVISLLSTAAWQGQAGNIGYCTAKSGLINFVRSTAMDLAPHRIRVNALTPSATIPDDPELAERVRATFRAAAEARIVDFELLNPWPRLATPSAYVGPLVFLASSASAMVTGSNVTVDGGALAKYWPQLPARV